MDSRVASALQAWAADPTAVPPAVLASIKEHVRQDRPCLLLDLPDVLLAYVLSKLPARSLGVALRACRATRRALAAAMQMRAQLLGLATATAMATTRELHFAEVGSRLQPVAASLVVFEAEPRPRKDWFGNYDFGPTNEMDLLSNYTFCFEFYLMEAKFTEDDTVLGGWRVRRTATGASVKLLSLTPSFNLSDDQLSELTGLFQRATNQTSDGVLELFQANQIVSGREPYGPFLCAKLSVHCGRTNEFRVLLDREWDTLDGDEALQVVNEVGFTHFKANVTEPFTASLTSKDEDDEALVVDVQSTFELQVAVLTDLRLSLQHTNNHRPDAPHTPETNQLHYEKAWFPFEKPMLWATLLIDDVEAVDLRNFARLINGCFDWHHIYRPLCVA